MNRMNEGGNIRVHSSFGETERVLLLQMSVCMLICVGVFVLGGGGGAFMNARAPCV